MIYSINKQAVEIKTKFESAPLTSPNEVCVTIGMLCKIYGLPIQPKGVTTSGMREELHKSIDGLPVPSDLADKLISMLDGYVREDHISDEVYELVKYSYDEQKI